VLSDKTQRKFIDRLLGLHVAHMHIYVCSRVTSMSPSLP